MLELPECVVLQNQLQGTALQKEIVKVVAGASPHKFAFFSAEPEAYPPLLMGKRFTAARQLGGFVELAGDDIVLLCGDGVNLRYYEAGQPHPEKHQLYIGFADGSALVGSVQMYGGMWAFLPGSHENPYYSVAQQKPSPLTAAFSADYFVRMWEEAKPTLSAKGFLATEQRIPGLGNGCLQDILFSARIHPQRKINTLTKQEVLALHAAVVATLAQMAAEGGRNTEKDLFGNSGGYTTQLSAKTYKEPCPGCGGAIEKKAFLGGAVYFCPHCQPLQVNRQKGRRKNGQNHQTYLHYPVVPCAFAGAGGGRLRGLYCFAVQPHCR